MANGALSLNGDVNDNDVQISLTSSGAVVTGLNGNATLTIRAWAPDEDAAQRLESDLRLRMHARLREAGAFG